MAKYDLNELIEQYLAPMTAMVESSIPGKERDEYANMARETIARTYGKALRQEQDGARKEFRRKAGFIIAMGTVCGAALAPSLIGVAAVASGAFYLLRRQYKQFLTRNKNVQRMRCEIARVKAAQVEGAASNLEGSGSTTREVFVLANRSLAHTVAVWLRSGRIQKKDSHEWAPMHGKSLAYG